MSLLGMLWRFAVLLRDDKRVRNTSGGNDSASTSVTEQTKTGIEHATDRAAKHDAEPSEPLPEVTVKPVVFGDGVCFTDGESSGSWIIADDDAYIDWRCEQ